MNVVQGGIGRGVAPRFERRVGRGVERLAKALALAGGLALLALIALTVVSIVGRAMSGLGFGPVPGDFELVENGVAFAVFAFLPWCQLRRGHVTVDVFVQRAGPRGLAAFAFLGNVLMTLAALLLAWRLALGLSDRLRYGDTTFILQMPVWWAYAAALAGACAFPLVSAYTAWRSLNEMLGAGEPAEAHQEGREYGE